MTKKVLVSVLLVGSLSFAACSTAAEEGISNSGSAEAAGTGTEAAEENSTSVSTGEIESLDKLDLSEFSEPPALTDFIPEDADTSGTKEDGSKWKIAWLNPDMSDESMAYMTKAMTEKGEEYGIDLVSYDAQGDPQKQTDQINSSISQDVDAIVINPIDPPSAVPAMKKAREAGIVVINGQNITNDPDSYDCYIGPEDTQSGQIAASMIMDKYPDGAKIVMVDGLAGSTCQINRTKGFRGVLESHPEYEILDEQAATNWSGADAMNIMDPFLSKYPDIDACFCQWDMGTLSCIQSAESVGRADEITFVSSDGQQAALDQIAEGGCFYGTAMHDFNLSSELQIMIALAFLNGDGDKIQKENYVDYVAITKDNASNFEAGW